MKPETRFRNNKVLPFLKTLRSTAFFAIQQRGISGDPDYMLCVNGNFVGLELKTDEGEPTPLQAFKLGQIRLAGGLALVARPSNWEGIKQQLSAMDKGE